MNLSSMFKSLCLPSKVYLVLSLFAIAVSAIWPMSFGDNSLIFQTFHIIYVIFWSWVLQLICKAGYKWISWVLVLAPFVFGFLVAIVLLSDY